MRQASGPEGHHRRMQNGGHEGRIRKADQRGRAKYCASGSKTTGHPVRHALVMVHKAHEMGLDKGPKFEELMRSGPHRGHHERTEPELQDDASKIPDKDVEAYYHTNEGAFQQADLRSACSSHGQAGGRSQRQTGRRRGQEKPAGIRRSHEETGRFAAGTGRGGEDFEKLQEEAAAAADFKGKPPTKLGKVRRTSLPPDQAQVFGSEAGRGFTIDYDSQRISDLQDWRKRHAPVGQGAGRNIFHVALSAHAGDAAEYSGVGESAIEREVLFGKHRRPLPADEPAKPAVKAPESGPK